MPEADFDSSLKDAASRSALPPAIIAIPGGMRKQRKTSFVAGSTMEKALSRLKTFVETD